MPAQEKPGHRSPGPGFRPRCPLCETRKGSRPCARFESTVCRADCLRVRTLSLCPHDCKYIADLVERAHAPSDDTIYR